MLGPGVSTMPSDSRAKATRLDSSGMRGSGRKRKGIRPEAYRRSVSEQRLFLHRGAQRDELLGGGGVDADRFVEYLLGGAGLERHRQSLHDLAGVRADHVAAQHPVGVRSEEHTSELQSRENLV